MNMINENVELLIYHSTLQSLCLISWIS